MSSEVSSSWSIHAFLLLFGDESNFWTSNIGYSLTGVGGLNSTRLPILSWGGTTAFNGSDYLKQGPSEKIDAFWSPPFESKILYATLSFSVITFRWPWLSPSSSKKFRLGKFWLAVVFVLCNLRSGTIIYAFATCSHRIGRSIPSWPGEENTLSDSRRQICE